MTCGVISLRWDYKRSCYVSAVWHAEGFFDGRCYGLLTEIRKAFSTSTDKKITELQHNASFYFVLHSLYKVLMALIVHINEGNGKLNWLF